MRWFSEKENSNALWYSNKFCTRWSKTYWKYTQMWKKHCTLYIVLICQQRDSIDFTVIAFNTKSVYFDSLTYVEIETNRFAIFAPYTHTHTHAALLKFSNKKRRKKRDCLNAVVASPLSHLYFFIFICVSNNMVWSFTLQSIYVCFQWVNLSLLAVLYTVQQSTTSIVVQLVEMLVYLCILFILHTFRFFIFRIVCVFSIAMCLVLLLLLLLLFFSSSLYTFYA